MHSVHPLYHYSAGYPSSRYHFTVTDRVIIERSISPGLAFQFIVEIKYDLCQRHFKYQFNPGCGQVTLVDQDTPFTQAKRHDITDIFRLVMICALMKGSSILIRL
jgi:hypothetical protein